MIDIATPLHNHTYYSSPVGRDGLSTPEDIITRCQDLGFDACGCTDHDLVAGHPEFFRKVSAAGLKPLLGIETYQALNRFEKPKVQRDKVTKEKYDNFHLLLIAINNTGLQNLWSMTTEAHRSGFHYHGRVDWELLERYNEGIICTNACGSGLLPQAILHNGDVDGILGRYLNVFGDRFYLELGTYPEEYQRIVNAGLYELSQNRGVPVVYGNDAHYAFPEQHDLHEAVIALQTQSKINDPNRMSHLPDLYIMAEADIERHLDYLPKSIITEAIANSDNIAKLCNVSLPERRDRIPMFIPDPEYRDSRDMILALVEKGFQEKVVERGKDAKVYFERLRYELHEIFEAKANLVDYLLMVRDYLNYARSQKIMVGPGRGSVGGCLTAYLLDIHEIDPIRYGLFFERFYNTGRETGLPDVDSDFPKAKREYVKNYMAQKYGEHYVADIGTITREKAKNGIDDMARIFSINRNDANKIKDIIDETTDAGLMAKWPEIHEQVGDKLEPYITKYPHLFQNAEGIFDHPRGFGIHPSGVLISDEEFGPTMPLRWVAAHKKLVTQFDMRDADAFGFMKMDILGVIAMDVLEAVDRILVREGKQPIDYKEVQESEDHPEEMWQLIDRGLTVGLFQIEDGGMARQLGKQLKPRSIDDLGLLVALNRPGPLRPDKKGGTSSAERYMARRNGEEFEFLHPLVEAATSETFGEFIYQEQVIKFFTLIGYSLQEADNIRSIMGKKKVEKMMEEKPRYLEMASAYMNANMAEEIWGRIVNFSKYGFNKSHGIGYGLILLRTLYAKFYHPVEFIMAGLEARGDKIEQVTRYVQEAQRMGIKVVAPQINDAKEWPTIVNGNTIMYGFRNVKHMGKASEWIVANQPYDDVYDFVNRIQENKITLPNGTQKVAVNAPQTINLIKLGSFGPDAEFVTKIKKDEYQTTVPFEGNALLDLEDELLGVALSDDSATILEEYRVKIDEICVPMDSIKEDGEYNIAGIIADIKESKTKKGQIYLRVKIVNDTESSEVKVWNNTMKRLQFIWYSRTAGVFRVKKDSFGLSLIDAAILTRKEKSIRNELQPA